MGKMKTLIIHNKKCPKIIKRIASDFHAILKSKLEDKFDIKKQLAYVNKVLEYENCENAIYFETTKRSDKLWLTNNKMAYKFNIQILKYISSILEDETGHLLVFSEKFNPEIKELFTEIFKTRSEKPSKVLCFVEKNDKIYLNQYTNAEKMSPIGTKICLKLEKVLKGIF